MWEVDSEDNWFSLHCDPDALENGTFTAEQMQDEYVKLKQGLGKVHLFSCYDT